MSTPFEDYIAPARAARHELWRLVAGVLLVLAGWFLWTVVVMSGYVVLRILGGAPIAEALEAMGTLVEAGGPASVLFQLATFAGIWPATWAVVRFLHGQPFATLLSPEGRVRWGEFAGGLGLAVAFSAATLALSMMLVGPPARSDLAAADWLMALAPLAVLILLQASGEELIFRGYMLQQLAARFRTPLVWGALPATLFGLAHYSSGSALGIGWQYVAVTAIFGITAAALVWRTGSLAAAMGLHTGMNIFAISVTGLKGVLEGPQLFLYEEAQARPLFNIEVVATFLLLGFVLSPLCRIGRRRAAPSGMA